MNTDKLPYYSYCFTHLKRDAKNGGAPHKPILLLSIIRLFEQKVITDNKLFITPELVSVFKTIWSNLVITNHFPVFTLPFYHMNSEPFWKLVANVGCEKWVESKSSMRSFSNLTTAISYALIDKDLSDLLLNQEICEILKYEILNRYFQETKSKLEFSDSGFMSGNIIYEESETYKNKILELKKRIDDNSFQEEIFIRGGIFKREIP